MANNEAQNNDLAYADTLWKSADALRGQFVAVLRHIIESEPNLALALGRPASPSAGDALHS